MSEKSETALEVLDELANGQPREYYSLLVPHLTTDADILRVTSVIKT